MQQLINTLTIGFIAPMSSKKSNKRPKSEPEKTHWNLYSLQKLSISKFVKIINKVLSRENMLIK